MDTSVLPIRLPAGCASAATFRQTVRALVGTLGPGDVLLDLSALRRVDDADLAILLACAAHARQRGVHLILVNPPEGRRVAAALGFETSPAPAGAGVSP